MLVLGAQVLMGFEFSGVFRDGFERLPLHARYLDGMALLLLIVTVALLITPETQGSGRLLPAWPSCFSLASGTSFQSSSGCGAR